MAASGYKSNTINGDLHRSKKILSKFDEQIPPVIEKIMKGEYPLLFINNVVKEFQKGKECGGESFIIPPSLFEIRKLLIPIEYPTVNLMKLNQNIF